MAEFTDKGEHCSKEYCRQFDFLPFQCNFCKLVYCKDHFAPESHNCTECDKPAFDKKVIICEICKKSLRVVSDESTDVTYKKHKLSGDCKPSEAEKNKCPVNYCKENLTAINTFYCKNCGQNVCMKHRYELDHNCAAVSKKTKKERMFANYGVKSGHTNSGTGIKDFFRSIIGQKSNVQKGNQQNRRRR